ncbi:accessory gene regulator B family protein [Clostridium botulinum]|nr:accessory gene regulator B family protein [Clostridium botulinum]
MINMQNVSNIIADKIALELKLDKDRKEVIAYGTFAFFQTTFCILFIIICGYFFYAQIEALMISFTIAILRKYSGGVHASSPNSCAIIGTIICVGLAIIILELTNLIHNLNILACWGIVIFVWAYYIIYKLAPVDSMAKPIKKPKEIKKFKKNSIITLSIYLVIILINFGLYYKTRDKKFIVYSLCIYTGVVWQIFTLTRYGHFAVKKLDEFLIFVIHIKRRDKSEKVK